MANLGSKSKGPFGTLGHDYKVVSTVFPPFSDCTIGVMYNTLYNDCTPPLPVMEKNAGNIRDFTVCFISTHLCIMLKS